MEKNSIVFTNDNCIGCNKCIKVCSAIGACVSKEEDGKDRIEVDGSKCVACGSCMDVCVHGAREFVDDTERFFHDLAKGDRISLLVAPAFKANYPDEYEAVLGGLKALGVNRIISVSFGADICTWGYLNYIEKYHFAGGISQPCPAAVSYIERYLPELLSKLFPVQSPLICAAIYARKELGITDKFAFLSPCIAKKLEIEDEHNQGLVQYNVTFTHLMRYLKEHNIKGERAGSEIEYGLGSFYPTPGGLAENVRWFLGDQVYIRQIEGERRLYEWLDANKDRIEKGETPFLFIDALNCEKGCICGTAVDPEKSRTDDALYALLDIREASKKSESGDPWSRPDTPEERFLHFNKQFENLELSDYLRGYTDRSAECRYRLPGADELEEIYLSMNKGTEESRHIDCTCCGYESCAQMATAIYNGFNHKENCIYYEKAMVHELELGMVIAEEANHARNVFLANMSHELRTPINAVLGMNEMILRESGEESITSYARNIKDAGNSLLSLVDELLYVSKMETEDEGDAASYEAEKREVEEGPRKRLYVQDAYVLAVDDNAMNLVVLTNLLKTTGLIIDTAESGDEALALSREKKYDVMFFDHMMPEKDGVETLRDLRSQGDNPNRDTPVVCLTANAIPGARDYYLSAGFDDYLTKPVNHLALEDILVKYLPEEKVRLEIVDETEDAPTNAAGEELPKELKVLEACDFIDTDAGLSRSGDTASYLSLVKIFYDTLTDKTDELKSFLEQGDIKDYTIKVHALKSSLRIIGAEKLSELAQSLENAGKVEDTDYIREFNHELMEKCFLIRDDLQPIFKEDEDDSGKESADEELMRKVYEEIKAAADEMDCDRLEELMNEMRGYRIPEDEKERFSKVAKCIDDFDYDGVLAVLEG